MITHLSYADYIVPLVVAKRVIEGVMVIDRYAGVGFFLRSDGLIATCKHIIESAGDGEVIFAMNLRTGEVNPLNSIMSHPTYDFAVGQVSPSISHKHFPLLTTDVILGVEVQALGFTNKGRDGENIVIAARLFKGYVSLYNDTPSTPDSRSTVELSFPSLKGFSGAPVICTSNNKLVGMLFNNYESTIELFQYSEVKDGQQTFKEAIHRVVESGLAHSASDIRVCLSDLGFQLSENSHEA